MAISISRKGNDIRSISRIIDERSCVNAIVGLHATGGSTNHTLHLPAIVLTGIKLLWEDFSDLSEITPLLARCIQMKQTLTNFMWRDEFYNLRIVGCRFARWNS